MSWMTEFVMACWTVFGEMAPYLLFGFLMAGVLSVFISPAWIERHLGGRGWKPVVKGALFGVPLPLCSCGVIPVTASIRSHGASRGAATSFLLSTPQTGVDSMLATYALLGPVFAVYRPLVAMLTGVAGGGLVSLFEPRDVPDVPPPAPPITCSDGCGGDDCHESRIKKALRYGLVTLPRDIARPLLLGIVIAGVISVFVTQDVLAPYLGGGLFAMLVMIIAGIPLYVCATASIPMALGFMHLGVSPGAALAFLIAGPATNAATIAVVWRVLGRRTALIYLASVAVGAVLAGLSLDALYSGLATMGVPVAHHIHAEAGGWFGHVSAVALLVVLAYSLWKPTAAAHEMHPEKPAKESPAPGDTVHLAVKDMTCSHCAETVARTLRETPGVTHAEVSLEKASAAVSGPRIDPEALIAALQRLGYRATRA